MAQYISNGESVAINPVRISYPKKESHNKPKTPPHSGCTNSGSPRAFLIRIGHPLEVPANDATFHELGLDARAGVVVAASSVPVADGEEGDSGEDDADVVHLGESVSGVWGWNIGERS